MLDTSKEDAEVEQSLLHLILTQKPITKQINQTDGKKGGTSKTQKSFNIISRKISDKMESLILPDLREEMQQPGNMYHETVTCPLPHLSLQY
jgi:hypothetical protein